MGGSSSLPAYAPDSLPKKVQQLPDKYKELRNPNGSVVHVVGVAPLEPASAGVVRKVIAAATPDSVLVQLCNERVPPVWELIERGTLRGDGSIRDVLGPLDYERASTDSRLRDFAWWFFYGLELEGAAALQGTCLGAARACRGTRYRAAHPPSKAPAPPRSLPSPRRASPWSPWKGRGWVQGEGESGCDIRSKPNKFFQRLVSRQVGVACRAVCMDSGPSA